MHFPRGKKISAIFYFDCEHILFAYLIKQNQKKFANFIKKFSWISNLMKIEFCWRDN